MSWKFSQDTPIYTQVMEKLQKGMITGVFPLGSRLPSVRDLAMEAGVNPNTMQRALTELERQGLVYSQRTAGRFVTEKQSELLSVKADLAQSHVNQFLGKMISLGYEKEEILTVIREQKGE